MSRAFAAAALLALCLGGCGREEPAGNARNETATTAPTDVRALPAAEQLGRAFAAAFGKAAPARLTADDQTYDYRPERLEWIGEKAVLISAGDNVDNSHAASGAMAIHYLAPTADGFRVTGAWPVATAGGTFGAGPSAIAVNRALSDFPVVYSEGGGTWQGYTCGWAHLVELGPDGPVASEPVHISLSNDGALDDTTGRTFGGEPRRDIEGRIGNVRRNQGFDVVFTGTERFAEPYAYRDHRFVRTTPESRAMC